MKKYDDRQLMFDFDAPVESIGQEATGVERPIDNSYLTFPKQVDNLELFDALAQAFDEINDYLSRYPTNINSFVFEQYFVMGKAIKDIEALNNKNQGLKIPSRERIRQIAFNIAYSFSSGERCKMLRGVRLNNSLCEKIKEFKESACGVFACDRLLTGNHQNKLQGIALLSGMNIVEGKTVLPIMKNKFFLSDAIPVETFWQHFRILLQLLQEDVRPQSLETLLSACSTTVECSFDSNVVKLILTDNSIFEMEMDSAGVPAYMLRFEHLKIYQQIARIVFEKKSLSIQEITAEMQLRGVDAKTMSLSQTRKKYPWCIPMGKTLWIYKEDEQAMDRIQDVIRDYCIKHVRFTYDEILDYLHTLHYDMKEVSLRNYITLHCRRLNADRNHFCLTSAVPKEEDSLWYKKAEKCTREREIAYHKDLIQMMVDFIKSSPYGRVPRKELRKKIAPFIEQHNVNINNFYKILNAADQLEVVEIEGEAFIQIR